MILSRRFCVRISPCHNYLSLNHSPLIFGEDLDYTLAAYREQFFWLCEPCLQRKAYASANMLPFDDPMWRDFVEQ